MGDYAPFQAERSGGQGGGNRLAALIDPVALEDRLRVARARRAEAVANRGNIRHDTALTAPPRRSVAPARPERDHAPAHPLVLLIAIGVTAAALFAPGRAPDQLQPVLPASVPAPSDQAGADPSPPATPQTRSVSIETPSTSPIAPDAAPQPPATPDAVAAQIPPRAPTAVTTAAASPAAPPEPPAAISSAAPPDPAATAAQPDPAVAPPPPDPTPRGERLFVHVPVQTDGGAVAAALEALRSDGFAAITDQRTPLTISRTNVRYFNPEDAAAAAEIAARIGPLLGGEAIARDFTDAPQEISPGRIEIWIAGTSPGAAGPPRQGGRLVRAAPPLDQTIANVAGGIESFADQAGRDLALAIEQAVRAIEGR